MENQGNADGDLEDCFGINQWNNASVKPLPFIRYAIQANWIDRELSLDEILQTLFEHANREAMRIVNREVRQGSINRNRGEWFELLLFWEAVLTINQLNEEEEGETSYHVVKMPSSFPGKSFLDFFTDAVSETLQQLNVKVANPDLLLLRLNEPFEVDITNLFEAFREGYQDYLHSLEIQDFVSIFSLKTTTRPDRRYTCLHEANTFFAIMMRYDYFTPYIVFGLELTDADKEVLTAPVYSDIVEDGDPTVPVVAGVFDIIHLGDLGDATRRIIQAVQDTQNMVVNDRRQEIIQLLRDVQEQ